jgi:hypothetical protein
MIDQIIRNHKTRPLTEDRQLKYSSWNASPHTPLYLTQHSISGTPVQLNSLLPHTILVLEQMPPKKDCAPFPCICPAVVQCVPGPSSTLQSPVEYLPDSLDSQLSDS